MAKGGQHSLSEEKEGSNSSSTGSLEGMELGPAAGEEDSLLSGGGAAAPSNNSQATQKEQQKKASLRKLLLAVFLLVCVAVIWVAAAALVQELFSNGNPQLPFFLTWLNCSEFIILIVLRLVHEKLIPGGFKACGRAWVKPVEPTDWRGAAKAALWISPVWFAAQGSYNLSLTGTTVSSSTILSTTSCVFTFILSLVFLKEKFSWLQLLAVSVTVAGAALTAFSDSSASMGTPLGDSLAIFSALCYGVYTVMIRRLLPDDSGISTSLFFGFVGVFNLVLLSPVIGTLAALGIEDIRRVTASALVLILVKGLADNVLSDLLWARAIQLSSATIGTIGLSLTIPLSMLSDFLLHGITPRAMLAAGSMLVIGGFIGSAVGSRKAAADAAAEADVQRAGAGGVGATHTLAKDSEESQTQQDEETAGLLEASAGGSQHQQQPGTTVGSHQLTPASPSSLELEPLQTTAKQ